MRAGVRASLMVALPHRTVWCCHDDGVPRKVQKSFAARRMSTKIEVKVITGVICVMVLLPLLDYSAENATQMHELGTWHTAEPMCSCCDMGARAAHHRSAHGVAHADVAMLLPAHRTGPDQRCVRPGSTHGAHREVPWTP